MVIAVWSLDDALNVGQGIERPFRCPSHDDTNASASVNVLKGVWYCYACQAAGVVGDKKKAPTSAQLASMLEPERLVRTYPQSWRDLFRDHGYWADRFPDWVCWRMGLGEDPFTGDAVFPVYTGQGLLAGVGRRLADPQEGEPRYKYPMRWSASNTLGGYDQPSHSDPVGIFVEGYADMSSLRECGADSFAVFGSGVHAPQYELAYRLNKKIWLVGFDMDEAGERAAEQALARLEPLTNVVRVQWPKKDPAECSVAQRIDAMVAAVETVRTSVYGGSKSLLEKWKQRRERTQQDYNEWLKEVA